LTRRPGNEVSRTPISAWSTTRRTTRRSWTPPRRGTTFRSGSASPYIIQKNYYNQRIISEHPDNVGSNICNIDPSSCLT